MSFQSLPLEVYFQARADVGFKCGSPNQMTAEAGRFLIGSPGHATLIDIYGHFHLVVTNLSDDIVIKFIFFTQMTF